MRPLPSAGTTGTGATGYQSLLRTCLENDAGTKRVLNSNDEKGKNPLGKMYSPPIEQVVYEKNIMFLRDEEKNS